MWHCAFLWRWGYCWGRSGRLGRCSHRDRAGQEGGAERITVGDGRQPLSSAVEGLGKDLELGLAELREASRDMGHRTVVLAQLRAERDLVGTGCEAAIGQRPGQDAHPVGQGIGGVEILTDISDQCFRTTSGEGHHRLLTTGLSDVLQHTGGQFVVAVWEQFTPTLGEQVLAGGPAPATQSVANLPGAENTGFGQGVEVPTHPGSRDPEPFGDLGGSGRAVHERANDRRPGIGLSSLGGFHNTSVTLFGDAFKGRLTSPAIRPGRRGCCSHTAATLLPPTRLHYAAMVPKAAVSQLPPAAALTATELGQLSRLRRWGTTGALLMMVGATSSYGAANPIPNPVDGIRVLGLMSQLGPAALAVSYSGMLLLVMSWLWLGRLAKPGRIRRLSRSQLSHTLAMWAVPLCLTPPIFSRDVYSYLAVGAMAGAGFDPYASGPYDVLGDGDVFAHQVDGRWQHTPSPYGPLFVLVVRGIVATIGTNLIAGVLLQRFIELLGVAAIIWALPRLARRCGMDPVAALWLGAVNPLVLFHLIAGGHNEALMLGAMLVGLVVGLERSPLAGVVIITLGVAIKATAAMALPFLVIALALRRSPRLRDLLAEAAKAFAGFAVTFGVITLLAGYGFGWVNGLSAPGTVRSFLSLTTSLGVGAGQLGRVMGIGDHTDTAIGVMQPLGTLLGLLIAIVLMWLSWRRGLSPILGLGLALGAFVFLGPVIQPWYLLWAALPLACATDDARFRKPAVAFTAVYSMIIMPNGATIPPFTIIQAIGVAAVVGLMAWWWQRRAGLPQPDPPLTLPADR